MSQKILFVILLIVVSFKLANAQCCQFPYRLSCTKGGVQPITQIAPVGYWMSAYQESDDEDLPFDNTSVGGYIMNWIVTLVLWFIYLTVALMILAGTLWSLTAKSFWSWVVCLSFAFFYAMLLGRYWGYSACLIGFVILFSAIKLFLNSAWGKRKMDRLSDSRLNKRK